MQKNNDGLIFYSGTSANIDDLFPLFDQIILLQADKKELSRRLTERVNNRFGKSKEEQDWLFDQQLEWDNALIKKGAIPIDATKDLTTVVSSIIEMSKAIGTNKSAFIAVDDYLKALTEKNNISIKSMCRDSRNVDCNALSKLLETNNFPKELIVKLKLHLERT